MSLWDDTVDILRAESHRDRPPAAVTHPVDRWTALDTAFTSLLRDAPPLQHYRVKDLWDFAKTHDEFVIEEAEFLLAVAKELVSLQRRLHVREKNEFTGEDGAA
jgi:hypothetical protein